MAFDYRVITVIGRVAKAELRDAGNSKVLAFSLASDRVDRNKEKSTIWFNCSLFGGRGQALEQYVTKGQLVSVSGKLDVRPYGEGKTSLDINVNEIALLGGGKNESNEESGPPSRELEDNDDEVPF